MTRFGLAGNHLPTGWQTTSARHLFRREKRTGFPDEQLLSVYRDYGVIRKDSRDDNFNKASEDLASYQLVEPNDLVINKMKAWQGSVGISEHRGIVSPAYFVAKPTTNFFRRYVHYLLRCSDYLIEYQTRSSGIRVNQWDLDWDDFRDIPIALPPLAQQTRIANFLDEQTARIDALIAEKERLDALLGEYRGSLISAAVTGQVDLTTGEALRRVHKGDCKVGGWPITRLRYVADLNPSVRTDLLQALDTEVSFLPMEAIGENGSLSLDRTRPVAEVRNGYSYFENGDIAFAKVTPCFENGKGALMRGLEHAAGFGTTELTVLRPKLDANPNFLNYVLQSSRFRQLGAAAMTGAGGLKRVPDEFTKDFKTAWPVPEDQSRIANFLDERTAQIDGLRSHCREHIALLREYRSSLISAAVTGQLDIDNFGIGG
ncbi:MAG: restriction endonuclease subunit S [Gammaproteobacteria bacterium]|nr:restriction endonuclease subunit S [Gammaproteobacteria bacterium]